MSCGCGVTVPLVKNQELRSATNGAPKTHWSGSLNYQQAAIYLRLLLLYNFNATVRLRGRCSLDNVTWIDVNPGAAPADGGYIDAGSAISELGVSTYQYAASPQERTEYFQIGIEVSGADEVSQGSVTLSASATFGPFAMVQVDLVATTVMLGAATVPTLVPGANTIRTYGAGKVRIEVGFGAAPGLDVTFYLATSNSRTTLFPDLQTVGVIPAADTRMTFVVEHPDAWSSVYYKAGGTTTASLSAMLLTLIP
jgi:hypothetical protein